jgi:GNAT superfamily N-acetyltransferase
MNALWRDGYHAVPAGKIASVVTFLEMKVKPPLRPARGEIERLSVRHVQQPGLDWYRDIYRRVGDDLMWFTRLRMSEADLVAIIHSPDVDVLTLGKNGRDEGLLELDFRSADECEIAFFGLTPALVGTAAGRMLMNLAIDRAFARPIKRLWLHTCTLDHPKALPFYIRSGFVPYQRMIEIADDPRLTGEVPPQAAPFMPVL